MLLLYYYNPVQFTTYILKSPFLIFNFNFYNIRFSLTQHTGENLQSNLYDIMLYIIVINNYFVLKYPNININTILIYGFISKLCMCTVHKLF